MGGRADDRVVVPQLLERRDEPGRVAGELHAGHVGERLPLAAHGRLHDPGDQRRQDQQREARGRRGWRSPPPSLSLSLLRLRPMPNHMNRMPMSAAMAITPTMRDGEGRDEDVVVLDVAQLVGEHALELDPVHPLAAAPW